ncbi:MAG: hypothetical protein JSS67_09485 [Bacteroidetes bacterium]|nr:hypothetical protein [Bacteroidota bacterium]
MSDSIETKREKRYNLSRTIYNIGMGLLIFCIGIVSFFAEKWNLTTLSSYGPVIRYSFGTICILYGSFRIYRGCKKEF